MDKNSIIGLILIAGILIGFGLFNNDPVEEQTNTTTESVVAKDPTKLVTAENTDSTNIVQIDTTAIASDSVQIAIDSQNQIKESALLEAKFGIFFPSASGDEDEYVLENDNIIVKISNKGARITEVKLKGYEAYENYVNDETDEITPLQLFDKDSSQQSLTIVPTNSNAALHSEDLFFSTEAPKLVTVENEGSAKSIVFRLNTNDAGKYIDFIYSLKPNSYEVDYNINIVGLENDIEGDLALAWNYKGLSTEKLVTQERNICGVYYKYQNDDRDYLSETGDDKESLEAKTQWIAFKHQYFSSILSSTEGFDHNNSNLEIKILGGEKYTKHYIANLNLSKAITPNTNIPMQFYFGPNDYEILSARENDQDDIINLGWGIFGWVNKIMIIPIFNVLNSIGLQIGLLIILLTLIIRLIILPLTYKNYKSSAKMRVLKPEIEKINEKFKDSKDSMKKQQETMALYRKTGVNPMAGCVPLLIQMPILFAAFRFFPASLDLRQKAFLWAEDLSAYDAILTWEAQIPFLSSIYGNHMSLFTILMCISTLFYTMMNNNSMAQPTQPGMPNMKVMMYIFPFMMLFFFNKFASGLSLYYLAGNLISMGLMFAIKKYMVDEDKIRLQLEENKKKPKKKSKFQQRLEEAAKQQRQK